MKTLSALVLLCVVAVGCSSNAPDSKPASAGTTAQAEAQAAVQSAVAAAKGAGVDPSTPLVADTAILGRIIAHDTTLTRSDIEKLFASTNGPRTLEEFGRAELAFGGPVQFRSADNKYLGALYAVAGRVEVAVWQDPTEQEAKEMAVGGQPACYRRVAVFTERKAPTGYNPKEDLDGRNDPVQRTFFDIGEEVFKAGDLRKRGAFCG